MGLGQTVGVALSAPIAIVDPNSRRTFNEQSITWVMSWMRPSDRRQINSAG